MNLAQQEAVNCLHQSCLVLAGAGSGKTRVITHKIARLLQVGVPPEAIAAITFTNKAAREMQERSKKMVGKVANQVRICTFHALGVHMLRESGEALGLKQSFSILDSDDVLALLKDAGGTTDKATARQWQWTISLWKNQGLSPEQALAAAQDDEQQIAAKIMARYQERLAAYQAVDFDDLIGLPLKLMQQDEAARTLWQNRLRHVLVDEYQDTNASQYELFRLLTGGAACRFTAVGDDDQSIYGWRGATLDNLRRLPDETADLKVVKLEQNYRSTTAILDAANALIAHNPKLFPKTLFSEKGAGEPIRVQDCDHEEHEAQRVVARIQSLRSTSVHKDWAAFAVLYRANHQARVLEQALRKAQIPYKVSGGQSYFERAEIKDLCAWLRLLVNQDDDTAFIRAATAPKRGIGHQTLQTLGGFASRYKISLFEALFSPSLPAALPARALSALHEFGRYVNELVFKAQHCSGQDDAAVLLADWLKDIQFEDHARGLDDNPKLADARMENVNDFVGWLARRCGGQTVGEGLGEAGMTYDTERRTLLEVAQSLAIMLSMAEREATQDVVTLSTLHAAKGLEWPHVVLAGLSDGMLPFLGRGAEEEEGQEERGEGGGVGKNTHNTANSVRTSAHASAAISAPSSTPTSAFTERLQEERRLMYVGITRAQETLLVTWPRRRKKGRDFVSTQPSRFIAEMALDKTTVREDPREKLKALRAEFAAKATADKAALVQA